MTTPTAEPPPEENSSSLAWLSAWLVQNHQAEQQSIAARLAKKLGPLWKILKFGDLKGTRTPWIEAVLPEVEAAYEESQRAAQRFVVDYRHAHRPTAEEIPEVADAVDVTGGVDLRHGGQPTASPTVRPSRTPELLVRGNTFPSEAVRPARVITDTVFEPARAAVSLVSTGPGEIARRAPSVVTINVSAPQLDALEREAMRAGQALSSRVAVRVAIDGGRNVVQRAVELDEEAIGFARVLNVNPCYFCAMLASRGAVYKLNSFAASNQKFEGEGVAKTHDGCRCGMRPIYSEADGLDSTAEQLLQQWAEHTKGFGGQDAINAFRRNYTPPEPPEAPRIDLHSLLVARDNLINGGFAEDSAQVAWMDRQIVRFGAILNRADAPAGMAEPPRRRRSAPQRRPSAATPRRQAPAAADTTSRQSVDAPPSGR